MILYKNSFQKISVLMVLESKFFWSLLDTSMRSTIAMGLRYNVREGKSEQTSKDTCGCLHPAGGFLGCERTRESGKPKVFRTFTGAL